MIFIILLIALVGFGAISIKTGMLIWLSPILLLLGIGLLILLFWGGSQVWYKLTAQKGQIKDIMS